MCYSWQAAPIAFRLPLFFGLQMSAAALAGLYRGADAWVLSARKVDISGTNCQRAERPTKT
jgi:hypothetical protein